MDQPATPAPAAPWRGAVAASFAFGALFVASTVPTPLYPRYEQTFGFGEFTVTALYSAYGLTNLAVLFFLGRLSDQLGRRRIALAALALALVSGVVFLCADTTGGLFLGRALSGGAAGLGAAAITAWIAELRAGDRAGAASMSAAANLFGLAFGTVLAGSLAQFAPWPLRLSWAAYALLMAATIAWTATIPEVVPPRRGALQLRPRIGVPPGRRLAFVAPAATAFATFALVGFYASIVPQVATTGLHLKNLLGVGLIVALFFCAGGATALLTRRVHGRRMLDVALALSLPSLLLLLLAEGLGDLWLLVAASVVGGCTIAIGYRYSLEGVNAIAPEQQRAEMLAAYLMASYLGNSLPVLGVGLLARYSSDRTSHYAFAGLLLALAVLAFATERMTAARRRADAPPPA